jgi:hypothetical protein
MDIKKLDNNRETKEKIALPNTPPPQMKIDGQL